MAHTPAPTCKVTNCTGHAYYRVTTSDSYGPAANISLTAKGIYCKPHATERAAELLPAWTARREAKLAKSAASYRGWHESFTGDKA